MEWQAIDTAPMDGTWVLVSWDCDRECFDGIGVEWQNWDYGFSNKYPPPPAMVAMFADEEWRAYSEDGGFYGQISQPTHWRPLPQMPSTSAT
jgi:hypothetical protein